MEVVYLGRWLRGVIIAELVVEVLHHFHADVIRDMELVFVHGGGGGGGRRY